MKQDYTHICIVLDASGSMDCIHDATVNSFNQFLESQRKAVGTTVFDLFQFNERTKRIVDKQELSHYHTDLMAEYQCGGCTALYDAICEAIDTLGKEFAAMSESDRPENVLVAIITDGEENSSRKFTRQDAFDRITHQRDVYSWEFAFLAANQDSFAVGSSLGMNKEDCADFSQDEEGMEMNCCRLMTRADNIRRRNR